MSVLYPRLLPGEADRLFEELHEHHPGTHTRMVANHSPRSVFAATGGRRVTRGELDDLRRTIVAAAEEQGFPKPPTAAQRNAFDQRTARILHEQSFMVPGEAAQRPVWAFLALVLLPDVCVWRWPLKPGRGYSADHFKGLDLTRHALGRLWTRAHVLYDPKLPEPYELVEVLGEEAADQIMTRRRSVAASPALVRAVVRGHRDERALNEVGMSERDVLRQSLMRLLRLLAFVSADAIPEAELDHLVRRLRAETRNALRSR
ncbi:DUF6339 family protein [Streptomyces albidoflavus]|uniref:DUF6339 family protein n=1 Tax=Streptomyces albidoflavus TaxID=1886 RepID=UPI000525E8D1|nr:DUF6339 family protein [Streptomyces albidoflavus]WSD55464.1 DUF6339 family protein [Streptomyces albidoflavus]WTC35374.1 DUF6339 family protein [Streptomyces albidoflavus]